MNEPTQQTIGKYDILAEIGRGGFGAVYRVRNRDLEREEALKVLGQHRQWDPTFVRRFQREARAAARLRHPHIVTIYEVGEVEGMHFISMEFLPGRTLAKLLADEGALPPVRVAAIIAQVAEALDYAHAQGLIHRDVKPANVIIGADDHATLTDFGLVKAADGSELSADVFSSGAGPTSAATAMGTPEYMAPEVAEPNAPAVDYRADLYSLGVVAYQALTGRVPFTAPTPVGVLRAHLDLAPPPLTQWKADLPPVISQVVLRAIAKNPADRHPSAGGFAAALSEAVRQADADKSRVERLATLYAQAGQALAARNWAGALAACGQVMALDAGYRDVGALFDRANTGLAQQRAWEAQQEEMAAQYEAGVAHLAASQWDDAIAAFEPLAKGQQVFRDADRKLAEAQTARAAAAARIQEQITKLRAEALTHVEAAERCVAQILALQPGWRDPSGALDRFIRGASATDGVSRDIVKAADSPEVLSQMSVGQRFSVKAILVTAAPCVALFASVLLADLIFFGLHEYALIGLLLAFGVIVGPVGFIAALLPSLLLRQRFPSRNYMIASAGLWSAAGMLAGLMSFEPWMSLWLDAWGPDTRLSLIAFYGWRHDFPVVIVLGILMLALPVQGWLLRRYVLTGQSLIACFAMSLMLFLIYLAFPVLELWAIAQVLGGGLSGVLLTFLLSEILLGMLLFTVLNRNFGK